MYGDHDWVWLVAMLLVIAALGAGMSYVSTHDPKGYLDGGN